jgi:tRNA1Val (adenine37-N6)-methyltransferase
MVATRAEASRGKGRNFYLFWKNENISTIKFAPLQLAAFSLITSRGFQLAASPYLAAMPKNYFQFKQFTVFQDKCAMKVCTDACLFGALNANNNQNAKHCLDIGTGTGLLSLMYAQKDPLAIIDAVEIDHSAAGQAEENFEASPWAKRLNIIHSDILSFKSQRKYGLIFSNPPFFEDDLRSPDQFKNSAKHDTTLGLLQLLDVITVNLSDDGSFSVLLPYHRVEEFIKEAETKGFHLVEQVLVKQTVNHDPFRGILFFSKIRGERKRSSITIKDAEGRYTGEFTEALKDYYLRFSS